MLDFHLGVLIDPSLAAVLEGHWCRRGRVGV